MLHWSKCSRSTYQRIYVLQTSRVGGKRFFSTTQHELANPTSQGRTLSGPSDARFNKIGVQQLSDRIHRQIFPRGCSDPPDKLVNLSKELLGRHELLGKNQGDAEPVGFELPALQGQSLDEHFYRLGMDAAEPFLSLAKKFARSSLPQKPRRWVRRSGWTKYYSDGTTEAVQAPDETMLTFDTEVLWKETSFAVMACAAGPSAWYAWVSPWLLGESKTDRHLIPLDGLDIPKVVIGHNIGYDRARVKEEYDIRQSQTAFMDTMSLHVAVNGMCSRQRPTWMKHRKDRELREKMSDQSSAELAVLLESNALSESEEELWVGRSSVNSLRDVAKFHCNVTIDKAQRDFFGTLNREGICDRLDELLDYCAADVAVTHQVYKKVFPNFVEVCPHPVSFAALRHLSSVILPVNDSWATYIANAEATYQKLLDGVQQRLFELSEHALKMKEDSKAYEKDPWLSQLDWSGQQVKMTKGKKGEEPRPAARQKKPGMPRWFKDLFTSNTSPINLTVRTRLAPILLRLAWDGHPLIWSEKYGWTFKISFADASRYDNSPVIRCDMTEEKIASVREDHAHAYFKLPHKDGPNARCVSPLAKGYLQYFENGTLSSEYSYAKEALEMNASCSYWISARDRITSQMVVYQKDLDSAAAASKTGYILPQVIPMGTITRRAVENTWLTASNAKKNRVGSELKAMVQAPPGYCFVGADVDSEELWIASLVGDAQFKLHGGTAIGFMTLEGSKSQGTDLHSNTARILGISRNDAKVFNYGRIYGAGLKFASTLLRQFNPALSEAEATATAQTLYKETKGQKTIRKVLHNGGFWRGGTESFMFNKLEDFAEQERPRTPVLAAGITEALMRRYINKGGFMTSRINWAIQSSGVDYLHLLIVSMDYLIRRFNIDARLAITVHDEIRFLVKEEDKYRAAMALQVSNIWTRAMFSQQMGIDDLPQSCAFFSNIDVDHVLRKEVDMDCVTPSHSTPIKPGETVTISQLLEKGSASALSSDVEPVNPPQLEKWDYEPREPVMTSLGGSQDEAYLRAQITSNDKELRDIIKEYRKQNPTLPSQASPRRQGLRPKHTQPQSVQLPAISDHLYAKGPDFSRSKPRPWIFERDGVRTHVAGRA